MAFDVDVAHQEDLARLQKAAAALQAAALRHIVLFGAPCAVCERPSTS